MRKPVPRRTLVCSNDRSYTQTRLVRTDKDRLVTTSDTVWGFVADALNEAKSLERVGWSVHMRASMQFILCGGESGMCPALELV